MQFFKTLAMCEGILQTVDPDSSFPDYLQPMIGKLVSQTVAGPEFLGRFCIHRLRENDFGFAQVSD